MFAPVMDEIASENHPDLKVGKIDVDNEPDLIFVSQASIGKLNANRVSEHKYDPQKSSSQGRDLYRHPVHQRAR